MTYWSVYILRCRRGALYTGISTNVERRIQKHNSGRGSKALKALGLPAVLVYMEKSGSKSDALKREAEIKRLSRDRKESLIQSIFCRNNKTTAHPGS